MPLQLARANSQSHMHNVPLQLARANSEATTLRTEKERVAAQVAAMGEELEQAQGRVSRYTCITCLCATRNVDAKHKHASHAYHMHKLVGRVM